MNEKHEPHGKSKAGKNSLSANLEKDPSEAGRALAKEALRFLMDAGELMKLAVRQFAHAIRENRKMMRAESDAVRADGLAVTAALGELQSFGSGLMACGCWADLIFSQILALAGQARVHSMSPLERAEQDRMEREMEASGEPICPDCGGYHGPKDGGHKGQPVPDISESVKEAMAKIFDGTGFKVFKVTGARLIPVEPGSNLASELDKAGLGGTPPAAKAKDTKGPH